MKPTEKKKDTYAHKMMDTYMFYPIKEIFTSILSRNKK